jgi:protein-S-isoprenylcysteine O-methyltransferase Ste14
MIAKRHPFATNRILWSRIAVVAAIVYVVFVPAPDQFGRALLEAGQIIGFFLLVTAALGRVWCLSYIAGVKNDVLVAEGPYSVVRNPLYVFNFIGAVGFGLVVKNPILAALLAVAFAIFYPSVIRHEEEVLTQAFGERFARYCAATPRWFPRWSNFHEPDSWNINPRRFRAGLLDAMWFLWAFLIWDVLEKSGALQWVRSL